MGARFSRFGRYLRRPLETQRSVDKILESKPISAPRHPTTKNTIEKITSETQEEFKMRDSKDEEFLNVLKDFKVDSTDVNMPMGNIAEHQQSTRPLPQVRGAKGNLPSTEASKGKISAQKLSELFQNRLKSPTEWTEQKISNHYKLNEQDVEILLKYFSGYAVVEQRELPNPLEKVQFLD